MIRNSAARKKGSGFHGRKWFITAPTARRIHPGRRPPRDDARRGLTAFLYHRDQPWDGIATPFLVQSGI